MERIELKFKPEQLKIVLDALVAYPMPFCVSQPLMSDISAQLKVQEQVLKEEKEGK